MKEAVETKLHTDELELRYGKVQAVVIEHNYLRRVIDIVDANKVSRTHAITWFPENLQNDPLEKVRGEIKKGALVGKTFKQNDYEIFKNTLESGVVKLPTRLKLSFDNNSDYANFKIYEFWAIKENRKSLFGVIAEIYSPDFLPVKTNLNTYLENDIYTNQLIDYLNE